MTAKLSCTEGEVLLLAEAYAAVYRWGAPRPVWERRGAFKASVAVSLTPRFVGVLFPQRLQLLPRRAHEPEYTMDVPNSLQPAGLLLLRENPTVFAIWSQTGKLTRLFLPDQRFETVTVGEVPLTHAIRYRNDQLIIADEQGKLTLLRGKELLHQWNDSRAGIHALTAHPRQPWVLTAGIDGILRVYDLQERRLRWAAAGHRWDILAVEFIDDEQVVSVGADRQTLIWRISAQLPHIRLRTPSLAESALLQRDARQTLWLATTDAMHQLQLDPPNWRTTKLITPSTNKEA